MGLGPSATVALILCCFKIHHLLAAQREHKNEIEYRRFPIEKLGFRRAESQFEAVQNIMTTTDRIEVHNIVLYPHKHSWCKTTAIKQVVAYPGCDSLEIDNNVCVGACFSYSIPRTLPSAPGEVVPYCDSCQPSQVIWKQLEEDCKYMHRGRLYAQHIEEELYFIHSLRYDPFGTNSFIIRIKPGSVTLKCTSGEYEGEDMLKQVEVIENCTCTKCSDQTALRMPDESAESTEDEKTSLDSTSLFDLMHSAGRKQENFTSLLNLTTHETQNMHNESVINERTLVLLGELSDDKVNRAPDQVTLQEILSHVEGEDHKVNEDTLADFVRTAEEKGHINVDIKRLRSVLARLENAGNKKNMTMQNQHRHQHQQHMLVGPHHSLVLQKEAQDEIRAGEFVKPTLVIAPHMLKKAVEGSELSYHNNLVSPEDQETSPTGNDQE